MQVAKLTTPPRRVELAFGPTPEDVLVMLIDEDVVTRDFLLEMDSIARRVFNSQLAGFRKALQKYTQLPTPEIPTVVAPAADEVALPSWFPGFAKLQGLGITSYGELRQALSVLDTPTFKAIGKKLMTSIKEAVDAPYVSDQSTDPAEVDQMVQNEVGRVAQETLDELESLLPSEADSVPLAQAEQLTYMAETIARVVVDWDLFDGNQKVPITEVRDLECCKEPGSTCRHAGPFLLSRSRKLLERLFQFVCFEAPTEEQKKTAKQ